MGGTTPMTCTVTPSSSADNLYLLEMAGGVGQPGQQNCNFVTTGKFLTLPAVLSDRARRCSYADYAGCRNYGSPYAFNCVCACELEDAPGDGCVFNWTALVS